MTTTDLIIIGAGPGGYHTAGYAAKHGLQVVIIEKGELGGTCLNVGCIPTKSFAHDADLYRNPLVPKSENGIDFKPILERKNQVVAQLVSGIATLLSQPGITLVKGEAHFVDAHTVEVGGEQYTAKNILIATGSQSKILPFMHDNPHIGSNVMTSTELLNIDFVPRRLCIIGAGVIGMEFASAFQTFGSEVTVVEFLKECLPPIDADIAKRMRKALEKRGIKFYMQSGVQDIRTIPGAEGRDTAVVTFERKGQRVDLEADVVLVATGRGAYMDHLNLEAAGVAYDRKGITVDDNMQTNVPGVYAIGDVNGRIQLAHAAGLEVFVTSRDADKRAKALKLGANAALETGARLPRKVDAVIESVGAATWGHSVRSVRPGGTIAICGATTGDQPGAELTRLFFQDIRVQGCTMGSREDFARLLRFVEHADLHPVIDSVVSGLDAAPEAFARMIAGDMFGKIVIEL